MPNKKKNNRRTSKKASTSTCTKKAMKGESPKRSTGTAAFRKKVTDEGMYKWALEVYRDEDVEGWDEKCADLLLSGSQIYSNPFFKEEINRMREEGRDPSYFDNSETFYHYDEGGMGPAAMVRCGSERGTTSSGKATGMTMLHSQCVTADFVAIDAIIRLGADTSTIDDRGNTALSIVCRMVWIESREFNNIHPANIRIVRRLLEVGVDPDVGGVDPDVGEPATPLFLACLGGSLEICEMLLSHGADPNKKVCGRKPVDVLPPRLYNRYRKIKRGQPKAKKCWCLSGKLFEECHENGGEVESNFGCPCGSGKQYRSCCQKCGIVYKETQTAVNLVQSVSEEHPMVQMHKMLPEGANIKDVFLPKDFDTFQRGKAEHIDRVAMILRSRGDARFDPAYAFALKAVDFFPRYCVGHLPSHQRKKMKEEFNQQVDKYIEKGVDNRPTRDIEVNSKLSADGTRLFKVCACCGKIEEEEKLFKQCPGCMMRTYCGRDCQVLHWRSGHKERCEVEKLDHEACPMNLPSQDAYNEIMKEMEKDLPARLNELVIDYQEKHTTR